MTVITAEVTAIDLVVVPLGCLNRTAAGYMRPKMPSVLRVRRMATTAFVNLMATTAFVNLMVTIRLGIFVDVVVWHCVASCVASFG